MDYQQAMEKIADNHLVARMSWNGGHVRLSAKHEDGSFEWVTTREIQPQDIFADDWYALGTLQ